MPSTPESEETRPTDAEVEAARCPDTTAKVLSPLARAMVEEAQAMKAHADYCFPDTGGVATIRRAIFLSRGGHKSGEVCHYQEWTGERILHAAGCAYFGIQDDTVPCQCPIVRANAAAALRQPREGAESEIRKDLEYLKSVFEGNVAYPQNGPLASAVRRLTDHLGAP